MTAKEILQTIENLPEAEKEQLCSLLRERPEVLISPDDLKVQKAHKDVMTRFDKSFRELAR